MEGKELRRIRTEVLGWTQAQLAEALGVDRTETIRRWETGERGISKTVQILLGYVVREARR